MYTTIVINFATPPAVAVCALFRGWLCETSPSGTILIPRRLANIIFFSTTPRERGPKKAETTQTTTTLNNERRTKADSLDDSAPPQRPFAACVEMLFF